MTRPHPRWCPLLIAQAVGAWAALFGFVYLGMWVL